MIQYGLIKRSARFLRWYRCRLLLDWRRLSFYLPARGSLLDVGCGVGSLDYEIARSSPRLTVFGIDLSNESVSLARTYHSLPNTGFSCESLETVTGRFDCIIFVDVFHHVPPARHDSLLRVSAELLAPGGYVLIKDIERRRGQVSLWMDRYVSGCDEVYLKNCEELSVAVSRHFTIVTSEVRYRFPFPHYYIKAIGRG